MTGWIENSLLRAAGLSDEDIAKLNARLPDVMNLIAVYEAHIPQITRVQTDLLPLLKKVLQKEKDLGL